MANKRYIYKRKGSRGEDILKARLELFMYLSTFLSFFLSFFFFFLKTDLLSFEGANRNERFILAWPNKQNKICKNETLL